MTKPIDGDTSIVTFKGHRVQKSLIRGKFSPVATTGQRYIYTGCSTGRLISEFLVIFFLNVFFLINSYFSLRYSDWKNG